VISCGLGGVQTLLIFLAEIDGVGECHKEDASKRGDERKSSTLMNVPSIIIRLLKRLWQTGDAESSLNEVHTTSVTASRFEASWNTWLYVAA
jgi:hypothetical protein